MSFSPSLPLHLDLTDAVGESIIYAIGDIHGASKLLDRMLAAIDADSAALGRPALLIFLGDAVNRGPATREVVDTLIAGPSRPGDRWIALRGNHEQALIEGFRSDAGFQRFLRKGGVQTALSYGVKRSEMTRAALRAAVPREHLAFLGALPLTCRIGGLLFVHAGVERGKALREQSLETLTSIREPFLSAPHDLPFLVVHGHAPSNGLPIVRPWRIGVDTGAVATGVLTAVAFDGSGASRFLNVVSSARRSA